MQGTTTNGRCLLNFKTGAFLAGAPVQPVVVRYSKGGRIAPAWESMNAIWHVFLMLANTHAVTCYEVRGPWRPHAAEPAVQPALIQMGSLPAHVRSGAWGWGGGGC